MSSFSIFSTPAEVHRCRMQAFLSRLRNQASSTRDSSSAIPSASTQAQTTSTSPETTSETTPYPPITAEQPTEATNAEPSALNRKIHPNLDELANQQDQQTQLAETRWKSISEFGQVPAALARVANRRVTDEPTSKTGSPSVPPTSFSSDFQRHAERRSLVRRASAPYLHSKDATWSTFGRKDPHPPVSLSRASSSPSRSRSRPPTVNQTPAGDKDLNNQMSPYVSAPESPVASIQTSGIPYVSRESASNSSNNHNSSSPAVSNVTTDRKDTPPRRSTKSSSEVQYPSLPSTFGRGSSRPAAGGIFHSEPTPASSKPATRPTSAQSLRPSAEDDPHKAGIDPPEKKSSVSKATGRIVQMSLHAPPRLTDDNNEGSSTGRPQAAPTDWMSNLSIKGILHFPSTTPNEAERHARLEQAVRIRERRRTLSASSTGKRRSMSSSSNANVLTVSGRKLKEKILIPAHSITQVFSVTAPKSLPQLTISPSPSQSQQQSTSVQPIATAAANPDDDQLSPPVLSVTAPTPSPSPSASRVRNNGLPATELGTLHVPPKRDRHVSLAVTGKRKAEDESETDNEGTRRRWSDGMCTIQLSIVITLMIMCSSVLLSSQEDAPFGIERIEPAQGRLYDVTWWPTDVSSIWVRSSIDSWSGEQERAYAECLADLHSDLCYHLTSTAVKASTELFFDDQRAHSAKKQVPGTHLGGELAYQPGRYADPWVAVHRWIHPPRPLVDWSTTSPATIG
jgi:hypothetical protein